LAKTHSQGRPLTFDELCEEAFGSGLHPWEFYDYDLIEYMQRRRGRAREHQQGYQEILTAAMAPHMKKEDRKKIIDEVFRDPGKKQLSLKEQYAKIKQRYIDAGVLTEDGKQ
jgi:hypothetical protein